MKLNILKPANGSIKQGFRIGRGQGSGKGGTAARGHKGAKSRSGYSKKAGFEGGQMPLQRRVPKFGFKNPNRVETIPVNLSDLQKLANKGLTKIDVQALRDNGLVSKGDVIKILGNGELSVALEVYAHAFSKSAIKVIEGNKGKVNIIE